MRDFELVDVLSGFDFDPDKFDWSAVDDDVLYGAMSIAQTYGAAMPLQYITYERCKRAERRALKNSRMAEGYLEDDSSYYEQAWRLADEPGGRTVGRDPFNELFYGLEGKRVRVIVMELD